ncbi:GNAT family N-acetyltransferase [Flexivirga sp. ID2601S]|uniref:GNAT family N-acetyltransferase n=1 Tax=Flexivirga aerilata TaxID=1656889 RepID=A0A849AHW4_9MICO|nr:GNAT family N-acetyltransferase [Flexivirga aerilata]
MPAADVVAAKELPPAPARRGRPHRAIGIADLERMMAEGMPPLADARVGDWWLRWANGYTGRANSTLPLGDPRAPLDLAVQRVRDWYAAREVPALFQLYGPAGFDPADDPLGALLVADGWQIFQHTLVMTADASRLAANPTGVVEVSVTDEPDADWWATASPRALAHRDTLSAMLRLVPVGGYLTSYVDGAGVGHVRTVHSAGWCGIFDLHTREDVRRRGVASALMAASARDAIDHGSRLLYLQVSADNEPAIALYRSLGFEVHHDYHYARSPSRD